MQIPSFLIGKSQSLVKITIACLLIFAIGVNSFAQYRGAPVKKERLIKALRSKQLQSEDIVAVINSNGVDFTLTPDVRKALIAAGARPEVIKAVANNLRINSNNGVLFAKKNSKNSNRQIKPAATDYNDLLEKAMYSYEEQKNPASAVRYLQAAIKLKPKDSKAYQMLGFVNLYGLDNLENTRKYMRESISNGGSAVFRVYHDDSGNFTGRCSGSLYISPERIRFESDDNTHTFETSTVNVEKIQTDTESSKIWKNHPIFKLFLKFGKEKVKFRFAPISGKEEESNMAAMFITESQTNGFKSMAVALR
jgi:tetratricopeptide (TPR) repeat protein